MKTASKSALFLAVSGIISLIVGFIVLANPKLTMLSLAITLGAAILASGIVELLSFVSGKSSKSPGWTLTVAILDIIIGLFLLSNIMATKAALPFVIGFWAMFVNIARISAAAGFQQMGFKNWWLVLLGGILGLIISMLIILHPDFGIAFITAYIGIYFIFAGAFAIGEAFLVKKIS